MNPNALHFRPSQRLLWAALCVSALAGWYGSGVASSKFGATPGDQTTGGQISFGLPSSPNRALGLLATSSTKGTAFGARFINGSTTTLPKVAHNWTLANASNCFGR